MKKWIDTPDLKANTEYIMKWHDLVDDVQTRLTQMANETLFKKVNMFLLQHFFIEKYMESEDFYDQFNTRLAKAKTVIDTLVK